MHQHGLHQVQTRAYTLDYHADTLEGHHYFETIKLVFRTVLPYLRKWTRVPDDYEDIYQQMLSEMEEPDFVSTLGLLTAWGNTPLSKR